MPAFGAGYVREGGGGGDGGGSPSLTSARSSRLAVTNDTRSFGQNRCILQRRQIGLYVYE